LDRYDTTCWSVVLGAAAGEAWDRETFSRLYAPVIKSYLAARWRVPFDAPEVDDATQEAFLQIFKPQGALGNLEPDRAGGFRAFLFGIVRNVALMTERSDRRRRARVQTESALVGEPHDGGDQSCDRVFDRAWVAAIAREAKELMARRARSKPSQKHIPALLELRYAEGLPPREIAKRLGLETAQVYEGLRRAKEEYRTALLDVLSAHNPGVSREDLLRRCQDVGGLL
jgi:RNA polymerase sigma-70 factor (ECF subfamily)